MVKWHWSGLGKSSKSLIEREIEKIQIIFEINQYDHEKIENHKSESRAVQKHRRGTGYLYGNTVFIAQIFIINYCRFRKKVKFHVSGWKTIACYKNTTGEVVEEITSLTVFGLNICSWLLLSHKATWNGLLLSGKQCFQDFWCFQDIFKISEMFLFAEQLRKQSLRPITMYGIKGLLVIQIQVSDTS